MLSWSWIQGLIARRRSRLVATAAGVAVAVALLASIGAFLSGTSASMTERAASSLPLDWQVQGQPGSNPSRLLREVRKFPSVAVALPVGYGSAAGFTARSKGAIATTGPGFVLGIPKNYRATFPDEFTQLIGAEHGVLIAQQLAANLGVGLGDRVKIERAGLSNASVRIDGLIDMPDVESLFQKVGAPPGSKPPPIPDNVLFVPLGRWHALFDRLATTRPDLVVTQIHTNIDHTLLPHAPTKAYTRAAGLGRNLESRLQGTGLVGNNLAHALHKARSDSLYADIVFLFLGLPGAILAGLVTATIAGAGADRRRRESALMRTRGATVTHLLRLALSETLVVALVGGAVGLVGAFLIGRLAFGSNGFGASTGESIRWSVGAVLVGVVVSAAAIALPAWRDARSLTVTAARRVVGRSQRPLWMRLGLDFFALAGAAFVYWRTGSNGYRLVLAVEGTTRVSVNYYSFLAPMLLWIGVGLLTWRLADLFLRHGNGVLRQLVSPLSGSLAHTVAATMTRQRRQLAGGLTLIALTVAFAASTAAFNATYKQQAEVSARLGKGADVVVTEPPGVRIGPEGAALFGDIPGVKLVEPLQHRFAYIGADLQDLYGVNPRTIVASTRLQDSFFKGGSAKELFARLAAKPNSVLVSQESVTDYQLQVGDRINLRIQDGRTKKLTTVPFTYAGIAKQFPSAPSDSFFVANASYITKVTGSDAVGTFLIQTHNARPENVAKLVAATVGTSALVSDITGRRKKLAGGITSVELKGLTRVELAFALVLAAAATGLLLWLGLAERRRTFAIAQSLGANERQLGSFIWSEIGFVTLGGLALGAAAAAVLALMLVKVLTGVFDPPPSSLAVPWGYLASVAAVATVAVLVAGAAAIRSVRRPAVSVLRDL